MSSLNNFLEMGLGSLKPIQFTSVIFLFLEMGLIFLESAQFTLVIFLKNIKSRIKNRDDIIEIR